MLGETFTFVVLSGPLGLDAAVLIRKKKFLNWE